MIKEANNSIYYHIVFYAKDGLLFSTNELLEIYDFIQKICVENKIKLYEIGGTNNHIHLLLALSDKLNIYETVNILKDLSSDFVINNLEKCKNYVWKTGFGYFNVDFQHLSFVSTYIRKQEQHHKMEFIFSELEDIDTTTIK